MVNLNQADWYWNERLATDYRFNGYEGKASVNWLYQIKFFF